MMKPTSIEETKINTFQSLDGHERLEKAVVEYGNAITRLKQEVEKNGRQDLQPDLAAVYYNRGYTLSFLGRVDDSIDDLNGAITLYQELVVKKARKDLEGNLADAYNDRGYALRAQGWLDYAIVDFERAVIIYQELINKGKRKELYNELARTYYNRGNTLLDMGRIAEALPDYEKAISIIQEQLKKGRHDLRNALAIYFYRRGLVLDNWGRRDAAVDDYTQVIAIRKELVEKEGRRELRDRLAEAYIKRSTVLTTLNRQNEAVVDFKLGLDIYQELVEEGAFFENPVDQFIVCNNAGLVSVNESDVQVAVHNSNGDKSVCTTNSGVSLPTKRPFFPPSRNPNNVSKGLIKRSQPTPLNDEEFAPTLACSESLTLPTTIPKPSFKPPVGDHIEPIDPVLSNSSMALAKNSKKTYNPITDPMPAKIGRVKLERLLGQGSMGVVFAGWDELLDLRVALKVMRSDLIAGQIRPNLKALFLHEAKLAMLVSHPNMVRLFDVGEYQGTLYLSYDYEDGGTLDDLLDNTPGRRLDVPQAVRIMKDVLQALAEAAKHDIVHCDVKPANILLTAAGQAKLSDLGLAKGLFDSENYGFRPNTVMGTPAYMAPEQAHAGQQVDVRADLYAVGVVMFQLLTGHLPFTGLTTRDIMVEHQNTPPPTL